MIATQLRSALDLLVTLVVGAVAVALLWRLSDDGSSAARGQRPSAIEDLQAKELTTRVGGAHVQGAADANAVIIEFADFECPFCGRYARETLKEVQRDFISSGKVQYVYRHLPLRSHTFARQTAQASECAARQGRFWDMHQHLYAHQTDFAKAVWLSGHVDGTLDLDALNECLSESDESRIESDIAEAARLGIATTPTFVLGTRRANGDIQIVSRINGAQPYSVFRAALNELVDDGKD